MPVNPHLPTDDLPPLPDDMPEMEPVDINDPSTWPDIPSNIEPDLALDALSCVAGPDYELDTDSYNDLITMTVTTIRYVNIMTTFYNVMGVFRILFCIFLLIYHFRRFYLNFKLARFQSLIVWMIQSLTVLQIVYSFMWNYKVFVNCNLLASSTSGVIDVNMFLIGILVTYYLYSTVNMIHQFAKKGRLPREAARKRL